MLAVSFVRDLEFFASGAGIGLIGFLLFGLAIPYLVLALRDSQNEERDPEIGLKSALYFMFSLSVLLVLTGLTFIVVDLLEDRGSSTILSDFSDFQRNGLAMMVSGIAFGLFHLFVILGFTNDRHFPATRRVFVGGRLAVHGLVMLTTFTILVVQVFQPSVGFRDLRPLLGVLMVWGPSWIVHLVLLRMYRSAPRTANRRRLESGVGRLDEE